jgi:1-acyl-sn-glycerol-3-phosphate acyltransferase
MTLLAALRSVVFMIVFYAETLVAVVIALPVAVAGRRALIGYARGWVAFHAWCCRWLLGIRMRIEGEVPQGALIVAAKHQAFWEPLDLLRILGSPGAVMKRQLADIPLWGWVARRYGAISVDRAGGAAALRRMMREAEAIVAQGRPVLIFPEGTRVLPGEQPPLQPGFAGLYRRLNLPVVPVALDSGIVWPRRSFIKRPGVITVRFGAPVPPGLPRAELELQVHAEINALERRALEVSR